MNANIQITNRTLTLDENSEDYVNMHLAGLALEANALMVVEPERRGPVKRVLDLLSRVRQDYRKQREYRRLLDMPEYLQRDVGLTQSDVRSALQRPFFPLAAYGLGDDGQFRPLITNSPRS